MDQCSNCGRDVYKDNRGCWVHDDNDSPRCWPGKDYYAEVEEDD